jgi:hypothetical protein
VVAPLAGDASHHRPTSASPSGDTAPAASWLSFGIRLEIRDYSDWAQIFQGTVTVRTADPA